MSYLSIKKIALRLLPKSFLVAHEERFRKLVFLFYRGSNYQCPVCEQTLRSFIKINAWDKLCPCCGSSARHRRLWTLLQPLLNNNITVLDFSPPRCLYRRLKKMQGISYTPTDFVGEFLASRKLDITRLELAGNSYSLIICYHVLEHIEEDSKAMHELYRVLKPGGTCFIQTPFKEGDTYEDLSIKDPAARKQHFDQEDHVRIYSANGLAQRLTAAGFKVEQLHFTEKENNYHGFKPNETVLVARK